MSLSQLPQAASKKKPMPHSKRGIWRAGVLIAIHIAFAIRMAFYYRSGEGMTPIEPSEAMQTLELGTLNAGFIFFIVAILSTLIFGRFFCGWACHIVALQDLCGWMLKKIGFQPKPFRSRLLVFVPIFAALYMFVWPQVVRLMEGRAFPPIVNHLRTDDIWATFPNMGVAILTFAVCGFLIVILLGNKGFCTYGCPYGAAFYAADRFSKGKIRVTDACNGCGHCTAVCTSNVRIHEEVKLHKMVVNSGCMKCMDCVSACPNNALYFGFGKSAMKLKPKRAYDFTWPEEIFMAVTFLASLYAFRGLYEIFPFLLSLGWSAIFAFLSINALRIVTKPQVRSNRLQLKSGGAIRPAGYAFGLAVVGLWVLAGHSMVVQYHTHEGYGNLDAAQAIYDGRVQAPEAEAERLARASLVSLQNAQEIGLVRVATLDVRKAEIYQFLGDDAAAEQHFAKALELDPTHLGALRGKRALMARLGRWEVVEPLARKIQERYPLRGEPARDLGLALLNQQKPEAALPYLRQAVDLSPTDAVSRNGLGLAHARAGNFDQAQVQLEEAVRLDPDNNGFAINLATVLAERSNLDGALVLVKEILARSPELMDAHRMAISLGIATGNGEVAWTSAEKVRNAGVFHPEAAQLWATAALLSGNAGAWLKEPRETDIDLYYRVALLGAQKREDEAVKAWEALPDRLRDNLPKPW